MAPLTPSPTCMHPFLSHLEPKLSQSSDNLHLIYGLKSNLISKIKYPPHDRILAKTHHFLANMTYRYTYKLNIFLTSTNRINTLIDKPICIQNTNKKSYSSSFSLHSREPPSLYKNYCLIFFLSQTLSNLPKNSYSLIPVLDSSSS